MPIKLVPSKSMAPGSENGARTRLPPMTTAMAAGVRKNTDSNKAMAQILINFFIPSILLAFSLSL